MSSLSCKTEFLLLPRKMSERENRKKKLYTLPSLVIDPRDTSHPSSTPVAYAKKI